MQDSVLTLGEKIVLAARLAAIEHVRQELEAIAAAELDSLHEGQRREVSPVGDRTIGVTDDTDAVALTRPVPDLLKDVFSRIEADASHKIAQARPVVRRAIIKKPAPVRTAEPRRRGAA